MVFLSPALVPRFVEFGGQRWEVLDSRGTKQGPGPNLYSPDPRDVWVDAKGLHLRIVARDGTWRCSQVVLSKALGYGTYRFELESAVAGLDRRAVLGLFTWDNAETDAHRELDVEVSRWNDPLRSNAQFVVQPYETFGNTTRFELPPVGTTMAFEWLPETAAFSCRDARGRILAEHTYAHGVPRAGDERAMINLWLFEGKPPSDGKAIEVVVRAFRFTPAPPGKRRASEGLVPTGVLP